MNPLLNIIKLFILNNEIYNKYNSIINIQYIKDYYKELYKVFKVLPLYKEHHQEGNLSDFLLFFLSQYPAMKPDEVEVFTSIFERIQACAANAESVVAYLEAYRERELATKIAIQAIAVSEGRAKGSDLRILTEGFSIPLQEQVQTSFVSSNLKEIYDRTRGGKGLRWRLNTLNRMLGSLRKGNFGFIVARPEVGKTTMLASEATFMATQMDSPILWVNNEEEGHTVLGRCYQACLGIAEGPLYDNLERNEQEYLKITGDKIKLLDDAGANKRQIERICEEIKPGLILLDQIDKLHGFNTDLRHDLILKEKYQWARELAKTYGPTIGTCQAGGSGENKKWLQMTDVDSSHTAKQGEADFILGIGAIADENYASERYLHLAKNKLPGDEDTIPALRHGRCPVLIKPEIARYVDKLVW